MSLSYSENEFRELAERLNSNGGSVPETGPVILPAAKRTRGNARVTERGFKSGLEKKWNMIGPGFISTEFGSPVIITKYEPFSLNISGGSYTPDFLHVLEDGRIIVVETKGNIRMKNARDSRSKFRAAANDFSIFFFVWVEMVPKSSGELRVERYDPFDAAPEPKIISVGADPASAVRRKSRRK